MPTHAAETLAAFQKGETRMVFARRATPVNGEPDAVFMEDNHAGDFREATRSGDLICIVPPEECDNPRLKAVHRANKRDGFSHHGGAGGHEPMGLAHLQSQYLLERWLNRVAPEGSAVTMEARTSDRSRRADVMLTLPTGQQYAFEVQYAGLAVKSWRERHESYRAQGIIDVWLWGHLKPHLNSAAEDEIRLGDVHRAAAEAGLPLLWINPDLERIGTVTRDAFCGGLAFTVAASSEDRTATFKSEPISDYRLHKARGLSSDTFDSLDRHALLLAEAQERVRLAAEEEARRQERERIRREEAEAKARAAKQAWFERVEQERDNVAKWWANDPRRAQILTKFGGWPDWLNVDTSVRLPFPNDMWQTVLYQQFIDSKSPGSPVNRAGVANYLKNASKYVRLHEEAVERWFTALVGAHVLDRKNFYASNDKFYYGFCIHEEPKPGIKPTRPGPYRQVSDEEMKAKTAPPPPPPPAAPKPEPMRSPFTEEERNAALSWYLREKVGQRVEQAVVRAENGAIPMPPAVNPETPRRKTVPELRASGYDIPEPVEGRADRCASCGDTLFSSDDLYTGYHDRCEKRLLTNGGNTLF